MTTKPPELSPPSESFLERLESAAVDAMQKMLGIASRPRSKRYDVLSDDQESELRDIEREAVCDFKGDLTQLEAALGMLRLGPQVGWRILYLVHSKKTIRTYEAILGGRRIRDLFPEEGPSSYRSVALNLAKRYPNFWKVAGGDIKIPRRKEVIE